jgi:hypothetical protein
MKKALYCAGCNSLSAISARMAADWNALWHVPVACKRVRIPWWFFPCLDGMQIYLRSLRVTARCHYSIVASLSGEIFRFGEQIWIWSSGLWSSLYSLRADPTENTPVSIVTVLCAFRFRGNMFTEPLPSNTCSFSRSFHSNGTTRYNTFNAEARRLVSVAYEIFQLCVTNTAHKNKLSFSTWTHTQVQGLCYCWRDTAQKPKLFRMANNRTVFKCIYTVH